MASCHEMKVGQVYTCGDCGLELQVVKACDECGTDDDSCTCPTDCVLECCDKPLTLKH